MKAAIFNKQTQLRTFSGYVSPRRAKKLVKKNPEIWVLLPEGQKNNPEWYRVVGMNHFGLVTNTPIHWSNLSVY